MSLIFSKLEFLIAFRYLKAKRKEGFISVIAIFSFIGIMIGVATLIIVMSVMNGFRYELFNRILGINSHLTIYSRDLGINNYQNLISDLQKIDGVRYINPLVENQVMVSANGKARGGLVGRMYRVSDSLDDFYLSSRNLGFFVLFFTLYATQYSGNTLVGYAAKAYRSGFIVVMAVTFMVSVIGAYLIYAPKLFKLSRQFKFITLGDFIEYRFKSRALVMITAIITIFALGSFILTNLKALGYIAVVTSAGKVSFSNAIIFFCLIMLIYESLGGMRSVAWTDTMQGILLLCGSIAIFILVMYSYGGVNQAALYVAQNKPQLWAVPDIRHKLTWISTIIIVFFGAAVYPHAIQRIYAAKDLSALKKSLQIMAFMPFVTTLLIIVVGINTIENFANLSTEESEKVVLLLLEDISNKIPFAKWLILLYVAAIISAIMSTVDSALLAISAIIVKDVYGKFHHNKSQSYLTYMGKVTSWVIMVIIAYAAIAYSYTIWRLFEMKLEILCQIAPLLFLAIHSNKIKAINIIYGIFVGITITILLTFLPDLFSFLSTRPLGIHAGAWGLAANFLVTYLTQKS